MINDTDDLQKTVYLMLDAYKNTRTIYEAVAQIQPQTDESERVLYAMWFAIDAYLDLNGL